MITCAIGNQFPRFVSETFEGKSVTVPDDFAGKYVVVYFYPKDMTPGCTTEGIEFTQLLSEFRSAGAEVIGVSVDSPQSHGKFCAAHSLGVTLLTDAGGALGAQLGILRAIGFHERTTFVLDKNGTILKIYESVKPVGHSAKVLEYVRTLHNKV